MPVCPTAFPNPATVNQEVTFSAEAAFPGEEWLIFDWDFGPESNQSGQKFGRGPHTDTVTFAYTEAGSYEVFLTAFHGFKSGIFGVGPFKFEKTVTFTVVVTD